MRWISLLTLSVLSGASCSPLNTDNGLSKSQAEQLVLKAAQRPCGDGEDYFDFKGGRYMSITDWPTPDQWVAVKNWISQNFTTKNGFRLAHQTYIPNVRTVVFYSYEQDGVPLSVGVNYDVTLEMSGCSFVPNSVAIIDTTKGSDPKRETVTYNETYVPTKFGEMLQKSGLATGVMLTHEPTEHTAALRRLDATGWRVDEIDPRK